MLSEKTERERQRDRKQEITPRGDGHTAIPSPPFSSQDLGNACTCAWHEFKPSGPGLELWSTTWEFSDRAMTLTAGLYNFLIEEKFETL